MLARRWIFTGAWALSLVAACGLSTTGTGGAAETANGTGFDAAASGSDGGDPSGPLASSKGGDGGEGGAVVDGCAPSPTGLVGWWPGDDDMKDRVNGNNGVSGTQAGATPVKYAMGEVGDAFDLHSGKNAYVQIASTPVLNITGPITMEAWIYSGNFGGRIIDKQTAGGSDGYMLDTYSGKPRIIITGVNLFGPSLLPTNTWIHEAGTWDGTTMRLYVNGAEVGNLAAKPLPSNNIALRLGADNTGASHFDGLIDEAAIYDRALTAAEILSIYTAGRSGRCK